MCVKMCQRSFYNARRVEREGAWQKTVQRTPFRHQLCRTTDLPKWHVSCWTLHMMRPLIVLPLVLFASVFGCSEDSQTSKPTSSPSLGGASSDALGGNSNDDPPSGSLGGGGLSAPGEKPTCIVTTSWEAENTDAVIVHQDNYDAEGELILSAPPQGLPTIDSSALELNDDGYPVSYCRTFPDGERCNLFSYAPPKQDGSFRATHTLSTSDRVFFNEDIVIDRRGRVARIVDWVDDRSNVRSEVTYAYGDDGRLLSWTLDTGRESVTEFEYDAQGRLLSGWEMEYDYGDSANIRTSVGFVGSDGQLRCTGTHTYEGDCDFGFWWIPSTWPDDPVEQLVFLTQSRMPSRPRHLSPACSWVE